MPNGLSEMNSVTLVFVFFLTLAGGAGFWAFASLFINRKSDKKQKDSDTLAKLEQVGASLRDELREDNEKLDKKIEAMREAFWPVLHTLDDLLPKMIQCLDDDERLLLREKVDTARRKL